MKIPEKKLLFRFSSTAAVEERKQKNSQECNFGYCEPLHYGKREESYGNYTN